MAEGAYPDEPMASTTPIVPHLGSYWSWMGWLTTDLSKLATSAYHGARQPLPESRPIGSKPPQVLREPLRREANCPPGWARVLQVKDAQDLPGYGRLDMYRSMDMDCNRYEYFVARIDANGNLIRTSIIHAMAVSVSWKGVTLLTPYNYDAEGKVALISRDQSGEPVRGDGLTYVPSQLGYGLVICRRCLELGTRVRAIQQAIGRGTMEVGTPTRSLIESDDFPPDSLTHPEKHRCRGARDEWEARQFEIGVELENRAMGSGGVGSGTSSEGADGAALKLLGSALTTAGGLLVGRDIAREALTKLVSNLAKLVPGARVPVKVLKAAIVEYLKRELGEDDRTWRDVANEVWAELAKELGADLDALEKKGLDLAVGEVKKKLSKLLDQLRESNSVFDFGAEKDGRPVVLKPGLGSGLRGLGMIENLKGRVTRWFKTVQGRVYCCYTATMTFVLQDFGISYKLQVSWCYEDGKVPKKLEFEEGTIKLTRL